jgi:hypothetical protein
VAPLGPRARRPAPRGVSTDPGEIWTLLHRKAGHLVAVALLDRIEALAFDGDFSAAGFVEVR